MPTKTFHYFYRHSDESEQNTSEMNLTVKMIFIFILWMKY